jgi:hypothetical protein
VRAPTRRAARPDRSRSPRSGSSADPGAQLGAQDGSGEHVVELAHVAWPVAGLLDDLPTSLMQHIHLENHVLFPRATHEA